MHRKRISVSTALAGQRLGINEVDEGFWLARFMSYDLGFIDLERKTLQLKAIAKQSSGPRQPVRPEVVTHVLGTNRRPCVRAGQLKDWCRKRDTNPRTS
jgi:hypothetical protein